MADGSTLTGVVEAVKGLLVLKAAMGGEDMKALVREHTGYMHADAVSRAPAGRLNQFRQAIRQTLFLNDADGIKGVVFVVRGPWERHPSQKWPKNVPIWIEEGTVKMDPRPYLVPAGNAARERFNRAVLELLQQAAR